MFFVPVLGSLQSANAGPDTDNTKATRIALAGNFFSWKGCVRVPYHSRPSPSKQTARRADQRSLIRHCAREKGGLRLWLRPAISASLRAQAQSRDPGATNQPDGQI